MPKKQGSRRLFYNGCALAIAFGLAALASFGCSVCSGASGEAGCSPGPGVGGTGGAAGTGAAGTGDVGGTAGVSGAAGSAGSVGNRPDASAYCGGIADIGCPDPDTEYCTLGCPGGDRLGLCLPRPTDCSQDCPGVCGCDGKFYCNACEAHRAGTNEGGACSDAGRLP